MQDPGLVPPVDEVVKLVPAGLAGFATLVASRALIRVPAAAGILAALAPAITWWVALYTTRVLPPLQPITAGERAAWTIPMLAIVAGASIAWTPRDREQPVPRRPVALGGLLFTVRAAALGGAFAWILKNFLASDSNTDGLPLWMPWAFGVGVALLQQLAILGAARFRGWVAIGSPAFAIGHLGPVCVTYAIASNAQLAGALGISLGLAVTGSLIMPGRRVPPAVPAAAIASGAVLAVTHEFLAFEHPPVVVWPMFALAAVAPGLTALFGRRAPLRYRGLVATGVTVLLTIAAVGIAVLGQPAEEPVDPDDPAALYEQYR